MNKPKVFVIMPFSEPYNSIYDDIIRFSFEDRGFELIRADGIKTSTIVIKDIESTIENCDLVLIEASEGNKNVYFEFGIAFAFKKEIIIIANDSVQLPFDTRHIRHLIYDRSNTSELKNKLGEWIESTTVFSSIESKQVTSKLLRGECFYDFFDSVTPFNRINLTIDDQIEMEIRNAAMIQCYHSYNTDRGSIHWLNLCSDPSYEVYRDSTKLLSSKSEQIVDLLGSNFCQQNPDFVSLGPGDGYKDKILLKALLKNNGNSCSSEKIFYYPIDISRRILSKAIQTITRDSAIGHRIKVKAVQAKFEQLPSFLPVFDFRSVPNLYVFLGNTLGNIQNEISFLQTVKRTMKQDDIIIIEVRVNTENPKLGGQENDQIGLSFSPLSRLGVPFNKNYIYRQEETAFSQVSGTRTIATHYKKAEIKNRIYEDILLSCVNYYNPESLSEALEGDSLGFEILGKFTTNQQALFVAKKK